MRISTRLAGVPLIVAVALLLASCVGPSATAPTSEPTPSEPTPSAPTPSAGAAALRPIGELGAPDCRPPSPSLGSEVQATGSAGVTAYGLMFGPEADSIVAGADSIKMAVRMTGSGLLAVHVVAPDGSQRPLDWGPDPHGGSTFQRPGSEWGVGFTFDAPGCWQLAFERGETDRADFWFSVEA